MNTFIRGLCSVFVFLVVSLCCVTVNPQMEMSISKRNNENYYNSVVRLHVNSPEKDFAMITATAFAIDKQHLVSAGHFCHAVSGGQGTGALENNIYMTYINNNGEESVMDGVEIVRYDKDFDLCLLKKKKHGLRPLDIALTSDGIKVGANVLTIGAPIGVFPVWTEGKIVSVNAQDMGTDYIGKYILSIPITGGNSGGPLILNGKVIGVMIAGHAKYFFISLASNLEELKYFLSLN